MKTNRVQLQVKDILEKKFKKQVFGFNQEQVDQFLDIIMLDYQAYEKEIQALKEELERFKASHTEEQQPRKQAGNYQVNYDILKRVSNLEKAVFGKKENIDL